MLLLRIWNYLRGYVIIIVEGYFLEKFINICAHRQLLLWNVKYRERNKMTMNMSIDAFKQLRPIAFKTRCRVHILKKKGLPFTLHKYKNRKAFIAGALTFFAVFFLMTSFIWDVSVTGNEKIKTEAILQKLYEHGIKPGSFKLGMDIDEVADQILLETSDLARMSIAIKGTKVTVNVAERIKPPDLIDKKKPCNIVATKDGVILSVTAKEGVEAVKPGQTVTKGQLLISGTIMNKDKPEEQLMTVHSMGSVKARTWYEASSLVETKVVENRRTGKYKNLYTLDLFTKNIKLFHGKIPYNNSEHVQIKNKLSIGEDLVFPIQLISDRYYEYEIFEKQISMEDARSIAAGKAVQLAMDQVPEGAEVLKRDVSIIQGDNGVNTATAIIECLEDIGVTQEIGGQN